MVLGFAYDAGVSEQKLSPAVRRAVRRVCVWTIVYWAVFGLGFRWIKLVLPQTVHLTWSKTVSISSDAKVEIEASRMRSGTYSVKQPLDSARIRLVDLRGEHLPITVGPNDSLCLYKDREGHTVRGVAPPEEEYVAGWLKENDAPVGAAGQVAQTVGEVFDLKGLDGGKIPGWTETESARVSEFTYAGFVTIIFLVWLGGVWVCLIPRK